MNVMLTIPQQLALGLVVWGRRIIRNHPLVRMHQILYRTKSGDERSESLGESELSEEVSLAQLNLKESSKAEVYPVSDKASWIYRVEEGWRCKV